MKIQYERSGGFAGLTKKATIDTNRLPPACSSEIHQLIQKVNFKSIQESKQPLEHPDTLNYRITLENDDSKTIANFNEGEIPSHPGLRELMEKLKDVSEQIT